MTTTPPLDQLAAEYEKAKRETDDGLAPHCDGTPTCQCPHEELKAERSAALALISALKESVAKAESDLRGVQAQWRLAMNEDKKWSDEFTAACKRADEAEIAASKIVNCECGGTGIVMKFPEKKPIWRTSCPTCTPLRAQFISGRRPNA